MKKTVLILIVISLFVSPIFGEMKKKLFINGSINFQFPRDNQYREIYGNSIISPDLKLGYLVLKKFYVFGGFGFLKKNGSTPVLNDTATSTQTFLSIGAGYSGILSGKLSYHADAGLVNISYKEEALGETVKGSGLGIHINTGLNFHINDRLYLILSLGYRSASDMYDGIDIQLGGLFTGFGLGILL